VAQEYRLLRRDSLANFVKVASLHPLFPCQEARVEPLKEVERLEFVRDTAVTVDSNWTRDFPIFQISFFPPAGHLFPPPQAFCLMLRVLRSCVRARPFSLRRGLHSQMGEVGLGTEFLHMYRNLNLSSLVLITRPVADSDGARGGRKYV
jgi:hypothetical protein